MHPAIGVTFVIPEVEASFFVIPGTDPRFLQPTVSWLVRQFSGGEL